MRNLIIALLLCVGLFGCTKNERAKNYGGTQTIELEPGQKLEMMTWKEDDLWIQTRPMRENETPEIHTFKEKSSWGVWEGTIIVKETK